MIQSSKFFTTSDDLEYKKLATLNQSLKQKRINRDWDAETEIRRAFEEDSIRAITVCFSDIEGRLHMLDYDKNFLLAHAENLTFDGSSIRGFTAQHESDLRLKLDWPATYFLPQNFFGQGKAYIFAEVRDKDGQASYSADTRSILAALLETLRVRGRRVNVAAEIEGFLFAGENAEKKYRSSTTFRPVTEGGYFNTLPQSPLRDFIDTVARIQKAVGFQNEKDHPEVAPSQFEINWSYTEALVAADQMQLYKMICRQVANLFGYTACFLPKPLVGVNGNGMHMNISIEKDGENQFFGKEEHNLSNYAWNFINGILAHGEELCLILNPSVNAYRRLDPEMEAPNEIKASAVDRGSMIRIPLGNEKTARVEVRTVAPDANPYLAIYAILKAGLSDDEHLSRNFRDKCRESSDNERPEVLPGNIYEAMNIFRESAFMRDALTPEVHYKYLKWKQAAADRCPRQLGKSIKKSEIIYHHEVTNQMLWTAF